VELVGTTPTSVKIINYPTTSLVCLKNKANNIKNKQKTISLV
jgi:protein subunit release factor A